MEKSEGYCQVELQYYYVRVLRLMYMYVSYDSRARKIRIEVRSEWEGLRLRELRRGPGLEACELRAGVIADLEAGLS